MAADTSMGMSMSMAMGMAMDRSSNQATRILKDPLRAWRWAAQSITMSKGYLSNTDQGDFSHCPSPVPPSVSHCPPVNLRVHPKELDGNRNSPLNRVNPDQGGKLRRTRVACSRCRKRRIKCSGASSSGQACRNCNSSGIGPGQCLVQ
ncbi:MAG: hypothetical protein FRX48_07976 [Lasallia pustulata]|uniref:Zn(2)-C6 fungal-type domain-containing protein n=1 Tax=Lasallia pustulata TaxID=136370 RepID=A0A5M8PHI1_9LECA|nr:MAG: hypothetical protein FRX48_07976 [Lasallia pustulata]